MKLGYKIKPRDAKSNPTGDLQMTRIFTTLILCGASGMAGGMLS